MTEHTKLPIRLNFIAASYNRKTLTLRAIRNILEAASLAKVIFTFTLLDDASSDGTADSVESMFEEVTVLRSEGELYWAASMSLAEKHVRKQHFPDGERFRDYLVWVNDDTMVERDSMLRILPILGSEPDALIVAATRDPDTSETTYSGFVRNGLHPLRFSLVEPGVDILPVQVFNGNLVFVPFSVARKIGPIDGKFSHALADFDYGMRCQSAGVQMYLAPGWFATCSRNPVVANGRLLHDWRRFTGIKGAAHPASLWRILHKNRRLQAPMAFCATYVLWWIRRWRVAMSGCQGNSASAKSSK